MIFHFNWVMFRFHVNFQGCNEKLMAIQFIGLWWIRAIICSWCSNWHVVVHVLRFKQQCIFFLHQIVVPSAVRSSQICCIYCREFTPQVYIGITISRYKDSNQKTTKQQWKVRECGFLSWLTWGSKVRVLGGATRSDSTLFPPEI